MKFKYQTLLNLEQELIRARTHGEHRLAEEIIIELNRREHKTVDRLKKLGAPIDARLFRTDEPVQQKIDTALQNLGIQPDFSYEFQEFSTDSLKEELARAQDQDMSAVVYRINTELERRKKSAADVAEICARIKQPAQPPSRNFSDMLRTRDDQDLRDMLYEAQASHTRDSAILADQICAELRSRRPDSKYEKRIRPDLTVDSLPPNIFRELCIEDSHPGLSAERKKEIGEKVRQQYKKVQFKKMLGEGHLPDLPKSYRSVVVTFPHGLRLNLCEQKSYYLNEALIAAQQAPDGASLAREIQKELKWREATHWNDSYVERLAVPTAEKKVVEQQHPVLKQHRPNIKHTSLTVGPDNYLKHNWCPQREVGVNAYIILASRDLEEKDGVQSVRKAFCRICKTRIGRRGARAQERNLDTGLVVLEPMYKDSYGFRWTIQAQDDPEQPVAPREMSIPPPPSVYELRYGEGRSGEVVRSSMPAYAVSKKKKKPTKKVKEHFTPPEIV